MNMKDVSAAFGEIEEESDSIKTEGFFSSIRRWNKNWNINKFHKTKLFYVGALGENEVLKITRTLWLISYYLWSQYAITLLDNISK